MLRSPGRLRGAVHNDLAGILYFPGHNAADREDEGQCLPPPGSVASARRSVSSADQARAAAALNHSGIAAVYGAGEHDGVWYIASEFIEGRTLRTLLDKGPLPVKAAIEIAAQVADALAAAQAGGVVHGDLKPASIVITREGQAKVLDFGVTPASSEATDHLADILSLGGVLYEMLTGRATPVQDGNIPVGLERIVRHCLEENPAERFQSAADLAFDLKALLPKTSAAGPRWKAVAAGFAVMAMAAIAVAALMWRSSEPRLRPSHRFTITLPPDAPLAPGGAMLIADERPALALSPDGALLAYIAQVGNKTQIAVRDMADGKVTLLPETEGGHTPFFSPDGAELAFFAGGKLKKSPAGGGAIVVLADAPNPYGGVWGRDAAIYFNRYEAEGIYRTAGDGGPIEMLTPAGHVMPELLQPGRPFPMLASPLWDATVYIDGMHPPKLVVRGFGARHAPTGHLVYAVQGKLLAAPFDRATGETTGASVSLFDDLRTGGLGVAQFSLSQEGTLVYAPGGSQYMTSFVWVDRKGHTRPLGLPEDLYLNYALSPAGTRLALTTLEPQQGERVIWIHDLLHGATSRLTPRAPSGRAVQNRSPCWAPDSRHIVYPKVEQSLRQLLWAPIDGSTEAVELWSSNEHNNRQPAWLVPMSFSPDGSALLLYGASPNTSFDVFRMPMEMVEGRPVKTEPEVLLGDRFAETLGQVSPDGRWLLYVSDESGRYEVYVTSYPKPGARYRISRGGGDEPRWNPRAPEIFFTSGVGMYAVDVNPGPEFRASAPRLLYEGRYTNIPGFSWDIAPDGQRFLRLENKDFFKPTRTLNVVTNFFDELRRRVRAVNTHK